MMEYATPQCTALIKLNAQTTLLRANTRSLITYPGPPLPAAASEFFKLMTIQNVLFAPQRVLLLYMPQLKL